MGLGRQIDALISGIASPMEPCRDDPAVRDLDPIRAKADLFRTPADGPPPSRVALNDSFATDSEQAAIAKWIRLRNRCGARMAIPRTVPPSLNAPEAASLQQGLALARMFQASVGRLIRGLYLQELTYGEFARKRFEFTGDAVALLAEMQEAGRAADDARLGQTVRQLLYLRLTWYTYLQRLDARRPHSVHNRGAIYT
jgi:hypothetical protein